MTPNLARIATREATIGVIGLGYVGLTVAVALADAGFFVVGVDIDDDRAAAIAKGRCPIGGREPELAELLADVVARKRLCAGSDYAQLSQADVVLIAVDTPLSTDHRARYASLRAACAALGRVMKRGVLVVVESTVSPGTCEGVVAPEVSRPRGLRLDHDFFLGHCPERLMPGRLLENLRNLPRTCGASSAAARAAMVDLYSTIVRGRLETCDWVTAELVKTAENAYRDVNIAFANELGVICESVGADFRRVRELVNQSPGRDVLCAGAGVGGHCIPKDPWLLVQSPPKTGASLARLARPLREKGRRERPRLIASARAVNDSMPLHVARLLEDAMGEAGAKLRGAKVAVYGYAYREDSDDPRGSPSQALIRRLARLGATAVVHDPWVERLGGDMYRRAKGAAAVVLMVAHACYRDLDLVRLRRALSVSVAVLVDGRFLVEAHAARRAGFTFRGLGRGENRESSGRDDQGPDRATRRGRLQPTRGRPLRSE